MQSFPPGRESVLIEQLVHVIDHDPVVQMIKVSGCTAPAGCGDIDDFNPVKALDMRPATAHAWISMELLRDREGIVVIRNIESNIARQRANQIKVLLEDAGIYICCNKHQVV